MMGSNKVDNSELQRTIDCIARHAGNKTHAANELGIPRGTVNSRIELANARGLKISKSIENMDDIAHVKQKLKRKEAELAHAREETFDAKEVRESIVRLGEDISITRPPDWVLSPAKASSKSPGIPTLLCSDWHFGEIIDSTQIGGVNSYNMKIAKDRARRMVETTLDLLNNHMVNPNYSGMVLALGGDMVSGDIHEELLATNETEIMPVVLELFSVLSWVVQTLTDEIGQLFVPAVGGNHGRNTQKIRAKGRNFTSFDWLVYMFLAERFKDDKRITFQIPNGPDALYSVYGHKYLLTHGDAYRGGDGMIGALGPIIRGDHKKRSRNAQIDMGYDTQIMGHFHQLIMLERLIVNGSLCGYNEYASANNFGFEVPRQALWITHPTHGITFNMPVNVDVIRKKDIKTSWVSWK